MARLVQKSSLVVACGANTVEILIKVLQEGGSAIMGFSVMTMGGSEI